MVEDYLNMLKEIARKKAIGVKEGEKNHFEVEVQKQMCKKKKANIATQKRIQQDKQGVQQAFGRLSG